jgi:hypothetical protein
MNGRPAGAVVRERGRRIREASARLMHRFRQSQVGTIRPALTINDGSTVVTDNYLKLRIDAGVARNALVSVRVLSDSEGQLM